MKNKLFSIIIMIFLIMGCSKKSEGIIGKWISDDKREIYEFNDDDTCLYKDNDRKITCSYQDDQTRITIIEDGVFEANVYEYEIVNDKLIMIDSFGKEIVFKRK